jgi:hypothetical protein
MLTRRQFAASMAVFSPGLYAQTQQERARQVIDRTIDALGGDAFRQMPGRLETGRAVSFYADEISGLSPAKIYTRYLPAEPGRVLRMVQRQVLGKKDDETILLSAEEGWDITYRGARALTEDRLAQFRESVLLDVFYILRARLDEQHVSFFSRGTDVVENQPVHIIDFYDADNRSTTIWIHSSTYLPTRQLVNRWDASIKDRTEDITRFTKYRDAGNGVMWPFAVQRERDGEKTFQLFSDSVKTGPQDENLFKLPPGIPVLKKK